LATAPGLKDCGTNMRRRCFSPSVRKKRHDVHSTHFVARMLLALAEAMAPNEVKGELSRLRAKKRRPF
jgi:hypothetical protein